jgi:H+/Cl- antiporter ClcA
VGGLFAPSLFLGALVGDIMGSLLGECQCWQSSCIRYFAFPPPPPFLYL